MGGLTNLMIFLIVTASVCSVISVIALGLAIHMLIKLHDRVAWNEDTAKMRDDRLYTDLHVMHNDMKIRLEEQQQPSE